MHCAIENSFLLNSLINASGFYFLIFFLRIHGFSLRSPGNAHFSSNISVFRANSSLSPKCAACPVVRVFGYIINKGLLRLSWHQILHIHVRSRSEGFGNRYSSPIDFHLSSATFTAQLRSLPKAYLLQNFFRVKCIQTLQNIDKHFTVGVQKTIIPGTAKPCRQDMLKYQP